VFRFRSRRARRWRPPRWYETTTYALVALAIVAVLVKKLATAGDTPLVVAGIVWIAWAVVGWWVWASRPPEPGEFR
jgi:hypothetical protein